MSKTKLIAGLFFILVGIIAILNNIEFLDFYFDWSESWPLLVIFFGIVRMLIKFPKGLGAGLFFVLFGLFWLGHNHYLFEPYDFWDLLPIFLVMGGVSGLVTSFIPRYCLSSLMTSLMILVPSTLWLCNNTIWDYRYDPQIFFGVFLIMLGLKIVVRYRSPQKPNPENC